jgi:hypothetical protein
MDDRPEFKLRDRARVHRPFARVERTARPPLTRKLLTGVRRVHVRQAPPQRTVPVLRPPDRPSAPIRQIVRSEVAVPAPRDPPSTVPSSAWLTFQPDPYLDYGRFLTPEGGILFVYKDIDTRLRHTLWRLCAWTACCYGEAWYVFHYSPVDNDWLNLLCLLAVAIVNWLIVRKPVEIYRRVEVRPDCMIVEDADIFWLRHMEKDWPAFQPDDEGNHILCGIYGTRFVEYLTVRRFDDLDRMAEVFIAHLQEAMAQLWAPPQEFR